jgi:hypothetical protein
LMFSEVENFDDFAANYTRCSCDEYFRHIFSPFGVKVAIVPL